MKTKFVFGLVFLLCLILFVLHFLKVGKAVYGDGRYYYSYLPSLLIQHTFNLSQSYLHTDIPAWTKTPIGLPANIYPIGPAIFWTIPYLLTYSSASLLGPATPFTIWFQIPIGVFVIFLFIVGLVALLKSLTKYFPSSTALFTTITIFFTTNLFFYGAIDILNSHAISFFLSALLIFFWLKRPSLNNACIQGIFVGLMMLVRPQDGLFILLPISTLLIQRKPVMIASFILTGLVFIPQILVWHFLI